MSTMPPNPNTIIAALLDIASAANTLAHCVGNTASAEHRTVQARDLAELNLKMKVLNLLPQLEPGGHLTGPARARHYLQSFLEGVPQQQKSTAQLVAEFETSMREYHDAELLDSLRIMCGYVENGSDQTVRIFQDDATRDWHLRVGTDSPILRTRARGYTASSFHQVIRVAAEKEIPDEEPTMCEFCGITTDSPCDAPPVDTCSKALDAIAKK